MICLVGHLEWHIKNQKWTWSDSFWGWPPRPCSHLAIRVHVMPSMKTWTNSGWTFISLRAKLQNMAHDQAPRRPGEAISHILNPDKAYLVGGVNCAVNLNMKLSSHEESETHQGICGKSHSWHNKHDIVCVGLKSFPAVRFHWPPRLSLWVQMNGPKIRNPLNLLSLKPHPKLVSVCPSC